MSGPLSLFSPRVSPSVSPISPLLSFTFSSIPPPPPPLSRFLTYLADLCVSKGVAIQNVQMMVCNVVLQEQNTEVLMRLM